MRRRSNHWVGRGDHHTGCRLDRRFWTTKPATNTANAGTDPGPDNVDPDPSPDNVSPDRIADPRPDRCANNHRSDPARRNLCPDGCADYNRTITCADELSVVVEPNASPNCRPGDVKPDTSPNRRPGDVEPHNCAGCHGPVNVDPDPSPDNVSPDLIADL